MSSIEEPETVAIGTASAHLFISTRRFRELQEMGVLPRAKLYDLAQIREAYIKYLRQIASGRAGSGAMDLSAERAKLAHEQAVAHARKNAIAAGAYVAIEAIGEEVERVFGVVREHLLSLPGKMATGLVGRSRIEIDAALTNEVHTVLDELAVGGVVEHGTSPQK